MPVPRVRSFATWFFQLKCRLLAWEIEKAGDHPAKWEKKGASLYTTRNVNNYPELRKATGRILNKIRSDGGFIFYYGLEKYDPQKGHDPKSLYQVTLTKSLRRIDSFILGDSSTFLLLLGEHRNRAELVEATSKTMFGEDGVKCLIEPPIQAESHLYQTLQCADWICGLVGRLGAFRVRPDEYRDFEWAEKYFGNRVDSVARSSVILKNKRSASGALTEPVALTEVAVLALTSESAGTVEATAMGQTDPTRQDHRISVLQAETVEPSPPPGCSPLQGIETLHEESACGGSHRQPSG